MENFKVIIGGKKHLIKNEIVYERVEEGYTRALNWLEDGEYKEIVRNRYSQALKELKESLKIQM